MHCVAFCVLQKLFRYIEHRMQNRLTERLIISALTLGGVWRMRGLEEQGMESLFFFFVK